MKTTKTKITDIKLNADNPRFIKDEKFNQLVKSIKEFPKMLELRPIVVNDDMIVLGGNMRLRACQKAGLNEVPIIKASDLTIEQQQEFIKNNNNKSEEIIVVDVNDHIDDDQTALHVRQDSPGYAIHVECNTNTTNYVLYIYAYSEEQVRDQLSECNIVCIDLTD